MFRTVNEFLALTGEEAPTPAEVRLVKAVRAGKPCVLADVRPEAGTRENTVRAGLLRLLITGATPDCGTQDYGVWLEGAWIEDVLDLSFARARGQTVLDACRFVEKPQFKQASFVQLRLKGSHLRGLNAQGIRVAGSVCLKKVIATGTIDLSFATIDAQIDFHKATFCGPPDEKLVRGAALKAEGLQLGSDLLLTRFTAKGMVDLTAARISGQLDCTGAEFDSGVPPAESPGYQDQTDNDDNRGMALTARRLHVAKGFLFRNLRGVAGTVHLHGAHIGDLLDDLEAWPKHGQGIYSLAAFTYNRFGVDAPQSYLARKDWVERGTEHYGTFYPQPYTHLAHVLRTMGKGGEARKVLYSREVRMAKQVVQNLREATLGSEAEDIVFGRELQATGYLVGTSLLRIVAGYGYKPFRAFWCLCVLWFAAFLMASAVWEEGSFAPNSDVVLVSAEWQALLAEDCIGAAVPSDCTKNPADAWSGKGAPGMDWESFSAMGWAADLVVPILDLGQTDAWAPSKDRGIWGWCLWWGRWWFVALGWIVSALGAAAVTGIMQRDRE